MGKIRFYSEDGSVYIAVRAEDLDPGNKYCFSVKVRKRRMPLQQNKKLRGKPATAHESYQSDPEAGMKLMFALQDLQAGIEDGVYSRVMLGTVFKSDELQLSVEMGKGKWKNFEADNYVAALLDYYAAVFDATTTPPSPPLEEGGRSKTSKGL